MDLHGHSDTSATWYSLYHHRASHKLSPHFKLIEFACEDETGLVLVHPALIEGLEQLRARFGVAVQILSGYRTPSHNLAIGGATRSRHMLGLAADVKITGIRPEFVAGAAERLGFSGIGQYRGFTHVDVRLGKARWDKRTEVAA